MVGLVSRGWGGSWVMSLSLLCCNCLPQDDLSCSHSSSMSTSYDNLAFWWLRLGQSAGSPLFRGLQLQPPARGDSVLALAVAATSTDASCAEATRRVFKAEWMTMHSALETAIRCCSVQLASGSAVGLRSVPVTCCAAQLL